MSNKDAHIFLSPLLLHFTFLPLGEPYQSLISFLICQASCSKHQISNIPSETSHIDCQNTHTKLKHPDQAKTPTPSWNTHINLKNPHQAETPLPSWNTPTKLKYFYQAETHPSQAETPPPSWKTFSKLKQLCQAKTPPLNWNTSIKRALYMYYLWNTYFYQDETHPSQSETLLPS